MVTLICLAKAYPVYLTLPSRDSAVKDTLPSRHSAVYDTQPSHFFKFFQNFDLFKKGFKKNKKEQNYFLILIPRCKIHLRVTCTPRCKIPKS